MCAALVIDAVCVAWRVTAVRVAVLVTSVDVSAAAWAAARIDILYITLWPRGVIIINYSFLPRGKCVPSHRLVESTPAPARPAQPAVVA